MTVETLKLTGKPVVEFLKKDLKLKIDNLNGKNIVPRMLIIRVGDREDDVFYEKSILKNCSALGIDTVTVKLPENVEMAKLSSAIEEANFNKDIHGIMLFRPLPKQLNEDDISKIIDPNKDIDCMSPINLEKIFEGDDSGFAPCTAKAVVYMLKHYEIPLKGANIVVIGRSLVIGKPVTMLLLNEDATVTICHSKTKNLKEITAKADIVVAAIGKMKFMNDEYFSESSIVIDVGVNDDGNGKICGDVDYDNVFGKVKALTPASGGVGSITTTILLAHTVKACDMLTTQ